MNTQQILLKKRDEKVVPVLEQFAPVWITEEKVISKEEAVQFNVLFMHKLYGWVTRRYRFDGFNDVLYYLGQNRIAEDLAVEVQMSDPYILVDVEDVSNTNGG